MATAAKAKLAALILAGTLVVGGAGATGVSVAAANGAFGQSVKTQVQTCKSQLKDGAHGIGQCVSQFASQHGQQERQQHSGGGATNTHGGGSTNAHGGGSTNAHSGGGATNTHGGGSTNAHGGGSTNRP